jgi:hypothetical protein
MSVCVVESHCNQAVCGEVISYGFDEATGEIANCRLPQDLVTLQVKVNPATARKGEFIPVRMFLQNSGRWDLFGLEVRLRLNQATYVLNSAILDGGRASLEELVGEGGSEVFFRLGRSEGGAIKTGLSRQDRWVLDLLFLGTGDLETTLFQVDVWAPCLATPLDQLGCHSQWDPWEQNELNIRPGAQLVSGRVQALLAGGSYGDWPVGYC